MRKNWILAFITAVLVLGTGIACAAYLYQIRHQGHFYVGVAGGSATVSLGQHDLGATPIKNATLPPGWYEFSLHTDYYTYNLPLRLTQGTATIVDWQVATTLEHSHGIIYELLPAPTKNALLTVTTTPEKAQIDIDSTDETLFSPIVTKSLTPGLHTLQLSLPGHESQTIPFTATPGYELKISVKLAQDE